MIPYTPDDDTYPAQGSTPALHDAPTHHRFHEKHDMPSKNAVYCPNEGTRYPVSVPTTSVQPITDLDVHNVVAELMKPWIQLHTSHDAIQHKTETWQALQGMARTNGTNAEIKVDDQAVILYMDGSGQQDTLPATWAIAAFIVGPTGQWRYHGYLAAKVVTHNGPYYLGAIMPTASVAETSAECWGAMYALQMQAPPSVQIQVRYDAMVSAGFAMSTMTPNQY